jgi:hypothetical protein
MSCPYLDHNPELRYHKHANPSLNFDNCCPNLVLTVSVNDTILASLIESFNNLGSLIIDYNYPHQEEHRLGHYGVDMMIEQEEFNRRRQVLNQVSNLQEISSRVVNVEGNPSYPEHVLQPESKKRTDLQEEFCLDDSDSEEEEQ